MWKDFLSLTRKEQAGYFGLVFIILFLSVVIYSIPRIKSSTPRDIEFEKWVHEIKTSKRTADFNNSPSPELFLFNPNEVGVKQMELLGLPSKVILNILKYREAGGVFTQPEKFAAVYGLDEALYMQLLPYMVFSSIPTKDKKYTYADLSLVDLNTIDSVKMSVLGVNSIVLDDILTQRKSSFFTCRIEVTKLKTLTLASWQLWLSQCAAVKYKRPSEIALLNIIELNTADTAELVLLKGIGPTFANRIVRYREKLGGFYNVSQLLEVAGISPLVLEDNKNLLTLDTTKVVRLNIQTASLRRMKEYPYMNFYMAKDIYEYRKSKGLIKSLSEVWNLPSFKDADRLRLQKYLCL